MHSRSLTYFLIVAIALECGGCAGRRTIVRGQNPEGVASPLAVPSNQAPPAVLPTGEAVKGMTAVTRDDRAEVTQKPKRNTWLDRKFRRVTYLTEEGTKQGVVDAKIVLAVTLVAAAVAGIAYLVVVNHQSVDLSHLGSQ